MIASLDGRIDCEMVDKISGENDYYFSLEKLNCQSTLTGRVTAEHYFAEENAFVPKTKILAGKQEPFVATKADAYSIMVDTYGKLRWLNNVDDGKALLCIVSEKASQDYLNLLKEQKISYIVAGKDKIDFAYATSILWDVFNVKRLALVGGGHINGAFLHAGLIDEVSYLLGTGIDGRANFAYSFDGIVDEKKEPTKLKLESVEKFESGVVFLRYSVCK